MPAITLWGRWLREAGFEMARGLTSGSRPAA
ncbi:hypothetical protein [Erwinia sp. E602]